MANGNGYTSQHHVVGGGPDIEPRQFVRLAGWRAGCSTATQSVCLSQKMATDRTAENETETFMHSWIKQNENCINKI